jgi:hypothetical protein
MANDRDSLLAGRNNNPLDEDGQRRATNTFLGLDSTIPVRYVPGGRTRFRCYVQNGREEAEIIFGADIYPGRGVADPNSSLSMQAAAAHEITHYRRWQDKTELVDQDLQEIDEALTSLEAILRFPKNLTDHETRQLVCDAIQRLQMFSQRKARDGK